MDTVISPGRQRTVIVVMVGVAFGALILGAMFSAPTQPGAAVLRGTAADGGGDRGSVANGEVELPVNPVEGWLPAAGDGTACSERVGVDLIPGYAAILTINGLKIPLEEMNSYAAPGQTRDAGATIGEFTWGPEEGCPFGTVLRPTNNQVIACIYRNEEGPENCNPIERPGGFDL